MIERPPDRVLSKSEMTDALMEYLQRRRLIPPGKAYTHFTYHTTPDKIECEVWFVDEPVLPVEEREEVSPM